MPGMGIFLCEGLFCLLIYRGTSISLADMMLTKNKSNNAKQRSCLIFACVYTGMVAMLWELNPMILWSIGGKGYRVGIML